MISKAIPAIFNREKMRAHRENAHFSRLAPLFEWTSSSLVNRLSLIKRDFKFVTEVGSSGEHFYDAFFACYSPEKYCQIDLAKNTLATHPSIFACQGDEEALPLRHQSMDLIVSHLTAHFINDLPGFLKQVNSALKPDGLMLGVMFGERTLQELSSALYQAQMEILGGVTPMIAPMITPHQAGNLLMRAGFQLPVVDRDIVQIHYHSFINILKDIQSLGAQSSLYAHTKILTKGILERAEEIYKKTFSTPEETLIVSLDFLFLSGFAYHPAQQKALKPHHTTNRLINVL